MIVSYSLQISKVLQTQLFFWSTQGQQMAQQYDPGRNDCGGGKGECSSAGCPTPRSCGELYLQLLLQVAVDFKAVVARIGHHDVSVGGEGQALWAVQRVRRCVDVRQERTAAVKHLTDGKITFHYFYWTLMLSDEKRTQVMWGEITKIIGT